MQQQKRYNKEIERRAQQNVENTKTTIGGKISCI